LLLADKYYLLIAKFILHELLGIEDNLHTRIEDGIVDEVNNRKVLSWDFVSRSKDSEDEEPIPPTP